jgi:hypothetical protein
MSVRKLILLEHVQALGWPGLAGAAALLCSLIYGAAVLLPAERQQQRARLQAIQAQVVAARTPLLATPAQTPTAQREQEMFYQDFPAQTDVTRWIERIYATAAATRLPLARGEYALAPVADTRLSRYQITLPIQGDYGRIRRFIAATLTAVPNLSLDELSLQRQSIGETQVAGQLRFSLYLARS